MSRGYSRKEFLLASGLGLSALALPARSYAIPTRSAAGYSTFYSEPSLEPPSVTVTTSANPSPGSLFVSSLNGPGQRGPLILDNRGGVVWFRPVDPLAINFRPQAYKGKPVLTWWEGTISKTGIGEGEGVIVDDSYTEIARVQAGNGFKADVHEFLLTSAGTALLTVFNAVPADLSAVGGPTAGTVLDSIVQEVDVETGAVLFEWHSLDHIPITDTYAPLHDPFDYFHVNSIDVDLDGSLLVSARNTSAIYKLDRHTGQVQWRLGGRSSDFQASPEATFMYQHDARGHSDGTLTVFDDGPSPTSEQARAIRLGLDLGSMRAVLLQAYRHPTPLDVAAMGNVQVLAGDAVMVGWGTEPYLTEFGPGGEVRLDAKFDGNAWNYRAFKSAWVGHPKQSPAVAAIRRGGKVTVYASWNGSTQTALWQVSAGAARDALAPVKTVHTAGFETAVPIPGHPRFVSVTALDSARRRLGSSRTAAVRD